MTANVSQDNLSLALTEVDGAIDAVHKAFGAPGDWGYHNPKGQSLWRLLLAGDLLRKSASVQVTDQIAVVAAATKMERVDALIDRVMKQFPGVSALAQARYYEEVHQELAPLAREIELQRDRLLEALRHCATDDGPEQEWLDRARVIIAEAEVPHGT